MTLALGILSFSIPFHSRIMVKVPAMVLLSRDVDRFNSKFNYRKKYHHEVSLELIFAVS